MFGSIGGGELLVILVLALLLFGPRKLPQIGKTVGRALNEFRRASHDFKAGLEREVELDELRTARSSPAGPAAEVGVLEAATSAVGRVARGALTDGPGPPPDRTPPQAAPEPPARRGADEREDDGVADPRS